MAVISHDHPRRGINERRYPRKDYFKHISFYSHDRDYTGNIRNISLGGAFVQSLDTFPVGQQLTLIIPFARKAKTVKRSGKVIWNNRDGFGLAFSRPKSK
jgi:Tfp pilus assembly protein PilZ